MSIVRFASRKTNQANRHRRRLYLESLEGRCLPSTVTNLTDHDPGSLRDAIDITPSGGTIDFQPGLSGTISLTTDALTVANDLAIAGPGPGVITVSGNKAFQVLTIAPAVTVTVSVLTIASGTSPLFGGGISNDGKLTLSSVARASPALWAASSTLGLLKCSRGLPAASRSVPQPKRHRTHHLLSRSEHWMPTATRRPATPAW